jgi:hypothetical protein
MVFPPNFYSLGIWDFAPKRYPWISLVIPLYPIISLNANKRQDNNLAIKDNLEWMYQGIAVRR